ncbi:MAG: MATE family efflux transporter [Draconibacterium sp.]|nr:MATE family efflux transporter [Draconibacterium sp.]
MSDYIPFYKRNLLLAFPIVLSQVGQITVHLVDNMMVGHVGTTELAAASFANNVFMIGMYFGMGITYGLTPLIGKAYSNGKLHEVAALLKNGMFTHFAAAIVLTVVMFGIYFTLPLLGQPVEVLNLAKPYFLLLCLSYLPFMLFFSLKQFFEGIGNTKIAMQITLSANVVNIIINYLFIFGKFGFPEMGLVGAGIGTMVSRLFMALLFIIYIYKLQKFKKYFIEARKQVFSVEKITSILKIGIPIGFQIIVELLAFGIGAIMMGWLGEIPLAAHQVAIGLASFTYMISLGVSQANTIRVSHQMGVKDYKSLRMAALASTQLVLAFMLIMGGVFVVARNYLPLMFTLDRAVIDIAAGLLIIAAIFQVFDGLQVVMLSTLRGIADVKFPMFIAFFAYLLVGIPTSYILTFVFNMGPQGIWYGYLVGLGTAGILFYFRFKYIFRKIA